CLSVRPPPTPPLFPYTTLFRSTAAGTTILAAGAAVAVGVAAGTARLLVEDDVRRRCADRTSACFGCGHRHDSHRRRHGPTNNKRSEEHTSELQSRSDLVCRLLL